jgi:hypothetical protein
MEVVDPYAPSHHPNGDGHEGTDNWSMPVEHKNALGNPETFTPNETLPVVKPEDLTLADVQTEFSSGAPKSDTVVATAAADSPVEPVAFDTTQDIAVESLAALVDATAPVAPAAVPTPFSDPAAPVIGDNGLARAQELTRHLSQAVAEVSDALEGAEAERQTLKVDNGRMQKRVNELEEEVARKDRFKSLILDGPGASLTPADLEALQAMTDSLTQDPDRLTVLFGVVQHAPKLATAISVYTQLRRMAEEG